MSRTSHRLFSLIEQDQAADRPRREHPAEILARILSPQTISPSHGMNHHAGRTTRTSLDFASVAALDLNAGEQD